MDCKNIIPNHPHEAYQPAQLHHSNAVTPERQGLMGRCSQKINAAINQHEAWTAIATAKDGLRRFLCECHGKELGRCWLGANSFNRTGVVFTQGRNPKLKLAPGDLFVEVGMCSHIPQAWIWEVSFFLVFDRRIKTVFLLYIILIHNHHQSFCRLVVQHYYSIILNHH